MKVDLPLYPKEPRPLLCVWEVTLDCDCDCVHCGSSAGAPRDAELATNEALALIRDLHELGCRVVTLTGGEPLLRNDWPLLAREVRACGINLELMTNGLQIAAQAEEILAAGFRSVSVSVDGDARTHDGLRRRQGCLEEVLRGTKILIEKGVLTGAVTQVNKLNLEALPFIHDMIVEHGFGGWMVQLTLPHGRAGEHGRDKSLCLEPEELLRLEELLLDLVAREEIHFQLANTIGYMSRSEPRLRAGTTAGTRTWGACQAGLRSIGITSDGTVRGCLSMPDAFDEGNIRERSLREIWEDEELFAYNRSFDVAVLDGPCKGCSFDRICRGGCPGLAWAATGKVGQNPYCLHALTRDR